MWLKVLSFICAGVFVGAAYVEYKNLGDVAEGDPEGTTTDSNEAHDGAETSENEVEHDG